MTTRKPRKLEKTRSHKDHGKMGNPAPTQTEAFREQIRKPIGDIDTPLGKKVFGVKLPLEIEEYLLGMEQRDRVILMREALISAVELRMKIDEIQN